MLLVLCTELDRVYIGFAGVRFLDHTLTCYWAYSFAYFNL